MQIGVIGQWPYLHEPFKISRILKAMSISIHLRHWSITNDGCAKIKSNQIKSNHASIFLSSHLNFNWYNMHEIWFRLQIHIVIFISKQGFARAFEDVGLNYSSGTSELVSEIVAEYGEFQTISINRQCQTIIWKRRKINFILIWNIIFPNVVLIRSKTTSC
jgi:hypothetical protein